MDLLMLLCADDVGAWSVDVEVAGGVGPKDGAVSDEGWLTKDDATNPGPVVGKFEDISKGFIPDDGLALGDIN